VRFTRHGNLLRLPDRGDVKETALLEAWVGRPTQ